MLSQFFVCNQCKCSDLISEAYPTRDFEAEGAPKPWLCTVCQGRPWHQLFAHAKAITQLPINRVPPFSVGTPDGYVSEEAVKHVPSDSVPKED